jgi:hypothetical protein
MKRLILLLPLLMMMSCTDQQLAKDLLVVANSVGELQTAIIKANDLKLVDEETTATVLKACVKVDQVGSAIVRITKHYTQSTTPEREQIVGLLRIAITELGKPELLGIKNSETQLKVQLIIETIRGTLNAIMIRML